MYVLGNLKKKEKEEGKERKGEKKKKKDYKHIPVLCLAFDLNYVHTKSKECISNEGIPQNTCQTKE